MKLETSFLFMVLSNEHPEIVKKNSTVYYYYFIFIHLTNDDLCIKYVSNVLRWVSTYTFHIRFLYCNATYLVCSKQGKLFKNALCNAVNLALKWSCFSGEKTMFRLTLFPTLAKHYLLWLKKYSPKILNGIFCQC